MATRISKRSASSKNYCVTGDIAKHIAHMEGFSVQQAQRIVEGVVDCIVYGLMQGKVVHLAKLGKLQAHYVPGREGFHPVDRCTITLPPRVRIQFNAFKRVTELLKTRIDVFEELSKQRENYNQSVSFIEIGDVDEELDSIGVEFEDAVSELDFKEFLHKQSAVRAPQPKRRVLPTCQELTADEQEILFGVS